MNGLWKPIITNAFFIFSKLFCDMCYVINNLTYLTFEISLAALAQRSPFTPSMGTPLLRLRYKFGAIRRSRSALLSGGDSDKILIEGGRMQAALKLVSNDSTQGSDFKAGDGSAADSNNGRRREPTILIVEDEILVRLAVADYLRKCGYRVLEASNAAEAQTVFAAREPIEIVFSDVNMPGEMNGFALVSWIRQHYPDVKVILTSGAVTMAKHAADACEDGPFLENPYSYEALVRHIRQLPGGVAVEDAVIDRPPRPRAGRHQP
jgi:CheY-like chemotaxis protein